ncbi:MAG: hypothetical protein K6E73_10720 [Bacteroidales bacterium]|nr:hypothetical protein [Bacteroidales bacterium]
MQWVIDAKENITQGSIVDGVDWGRGEDNPLSIVLSNACDFEHDKLSFLVVAALVPAKETLMATKEYKSKVASADEGNGLSKKSWESFADYLKNFIHNKVVGRYFFFDPNPVIDAPLFLVDFQQICSLDADMMENLTNVGQLDHPHVEKMMAHFVGYTGRVPSDRADETQEGEYLQELQGDYHVKVSK